MWFQVASAPANGQQSPFGRVYHDLPPRPPQIHRAMYHCDSSDVLAFAEQVNFLRTLLDQTMVPVDALIAATLREAYRLRRADRTWLTQAGRFLSLLLKDDYDRLQVILDQVHI